MNEPHLETDQPSFDLPRVLFKDFYYSIRLLAYVFLMLFAAVSLIQSLKISSSIFLIASAFATLFIFTDLIARAVNNDFFSLPQQSERLSRIIRLATLTTILTITIEIIFNSV